MRSLQHAATPCNSRPPRRRTTPVLRETPSPLRRQNRRSAGWSLRRSRRLIPSRLRSRNRVLLRPRRKKKRRRERTKKRKRTKNLSLRAVGGSPLRLLSGNWPRPASPGRGQFFMTAHRERTAPRNRAHALFFSKSRNTLGGRSFSSDIEPQAEAGLQPLRNIRRMTLSGLHETASKAYCEGGFSCGGLTGLLAAGAGEPGAGGAAGCCTAK